MNCKPGDLAVIVCDPDCGGVDVGKIIKVVKAIGVNRFGNFEWECKSEGSKLDGTLGVGGKRAYSFVSDIPDAWLRPIRPDSEPETTEREVEHAA